MTLSDKTEERLVDIVRLQPMKSKELQSHWDLENGSEVHHYLESKLKNRYYRNDNSFTRVTAEAAEPVGVELGVEGDDEAESVPSVIRVPSLGARVLEAVVGLDEHFESVISVLNKLHDELGIDPDVGDVRCALQSLCRKGVTGVVYRTVLTFCLAVERDEVDVKVV